MLRKIRGLDLIAREAHYHNHSRHNWTRMASSSPTFKLSEVSQILDANTHASSLYWLLKWSKDLQ